MAIKIIGIDPAPSKGSTIFDGNEFYKRKDPDEVLQFLENMKGSPVLVCWDAPLTGPGDLTDGKFTDRPIEKFLRRQLGLNGKNKQDGVKGVSVQGYASCTHWTISRYIFGLPRFSRFEVDQEMLPFKPATNQDILDNRIVEVHPVVALYLWLGKVPHYKGKDDVAKEIWKELADKNIINSCLTAATLEKGIADDDQLDALVAYCLGCLWVNNDGVSLIGDHTNGQLLLPDNSTQLQNGFEQFMRMNEKRKRGL
jgi:hypothetical protein